MIMKTKNTVGDEGDWVFARRHGRGWQLAAHTPSSSISDDDDNVRQTYIDGGWLQVDFGR